MTTSVILMSFVILVIMETTQSASFYKSFFDDDSDIRIGNLIAERFDRDWFSGQVSISIFYLKV